MRVLGIETSCDETAAAVIEDGSGILSNVVFSQAQYHARYGGIVPELASRQHMVTVVPAVRQALDESGLELGSLDAIAVTHGPGLAGSLLIGVGAAKGLALAADLPLLGVNHLEGHVYAAWLEDGDPEREIGFPLLCLITSGGHTDLVAMEGHGSYELLGRTRDDAAGEAFDKAARVLGLGFPGGPAIQAAAVDGDGTAERFPRPDVKRSLDFSFSGLKTAVMRRAESKGIYPPSPERPPDPAEVARIAQAYQESLVEFMVRRRSGARCRPSSAAAHACPRAFLLWTWSGVAANTLLRQEMAERSPVPVVVPRPALCTDNGAMIGAAAFLPAAEGSPPRRLHPPVGPRRRPEPRETELG